MEFITPQLNIIKRTTTLSWLCLFTLSIIASGMHVSAQSSSDIYKRLSAPFYDPGQDCGTDSGSASPSDTDVGGDARSSLTYPLNLDDAQIVTGLKRYMESVNPHSVFLTNPAGANRTIQALVASSKHVNISPFLVAAIAQKESSLGDPGDYNVKNGNNSFGRTATDSQPHFIGSHQWYKWGSVIASVDYTNAENARSPNSDQVTYLRQQFGNGIDKGTLQEIINTYAPSSDGNNPVAYAQTVKGQLARMTKLAGGEVDPADSIPDSDVPDNTPVAAACGTCSTTVNTDLSGGDNIQKAYNFFVQKGLTPTQSSGVLGNLIQESHVNPKSNQSTGPGRGIAQWSEGGRWTVLVNWARDNGGRDPEALDTQLDFMWYELGKSYPGALAALKRATTINEAVIAIQDGYEQPGDPQTTNRENYAHDVFNKYGSSADGTVITTNAAGGSSGSCQSTGAGEDSKYTDGFLVYSQYDSRWANAPYASSTIGVSGCGPSAMAMIITALNNTPVTPLETSKYAASRGLYVPGSGSSWNLGPVLAQKWGLKAASIGADKAKITAALQSGGLVLAVGKGPVPFTSGGHFIVIRAVTSDGKWKVGDSGHNDTSDKEWDPQQIIDSIVNNNGGSVVAISK